MSVKVVSSIMPCFFSVNGSTTNSKPSPQIPITIVAKTPRIRA